MRQYRTNFGAANIASIGWLAACACYVNPNETVFRFSRKAWLLQIAIQLMLTGADIELPTVPRASDDAADKVAIAKRAALMWADPIDGEQLTIDVENGEQLVAGYRLDCMTQWTSVCIGNSSPGHSMMSV
jgi:hypothetical protein